MWSKLNNYLDIITHPAFIVAVPLLFSLISYILIPNKSYLPTIIYILLNFGLFYFKLWYEHPLDKKFP